ncbi:MAG: HAMP domain-containing histidine kinase [candidate division Zixibacteria bacterium]|nr:HAMP domain-containing histidine kinase [candidate division Zixibacteria bacterium]
MAQNASRSGLVDRLYIGKSTFFKVFLLLGVAIISVIFIWYTLEVIEQLKIGTRSQVDKYVKMWQMAANSPTSGQELQFIFDEIIVKADFPIIVLDGDNEPIHWRNIDGVSPTDYSPENLKLLREEAQQMMERNGAIPLMFGEDEVSYFCYGDTLAIRQLTLMPYIEIGIVLAFLAVAFIGFQNIKRSEERHIWIGMAKETAHQLGTPISSLMGWVEVMTGEAELSENLSDEEHARLKEAMSNMSVDITRLNRIANRFGQIGSVPEVNQCDMNQLVLDTVEYYRRRLPFEGKGIAICLQTNKLPPLCVNAELFSWALENLLKNSIQAVDSRTGRIDISTELDQSGKFAIVSLTDNGPGISPAMARKVFRAGFTTKKRGWGLGLTLVKRIVEEYHGGRIILKRSQPGQTVFEITLPVVTGSKG